MSDFFRNVTPPKWNGKISVGLVVTIIVVAAAGIGLFTSAFVVDQTEQAVVTTFGKFNRVVEAGLHFKLPFGIERHANVPTQKTQNMSFGFMSDPDDPNSVVDYPEESIMLTGDLNIIDVQWIIQYRIVDIKAWLFNVHQQGKTIRDISQSVVNELVGDRTLFEVLGPARTIIENQSVDEMNRLLAQYSIGVQITQVKLQNVVPPTGSVRAAFEDVNKAQQDMNRLINEGKQQFNTEIPKARGSALQIVKQAQGYASERVNQAEGDVARFLSVLKQYQLDRENTKVRLYNEMIESVFGPGGTGTSDGEKPNLIDKKLGGVLPFLNLPGSKSGTTGAAQ